MATSTTPDSRFVRIRDPASLTPSIPAEYQFLEHPPLHYRINFHHPAYLEDDDLLFSLHAWDHPDGGIHHGFAHNACAIIADNRWDGYLSTTRSSADKVMLAWDEALPSSIRDYYFCVPDLGHSGHGGDHDRSVAPSSSPWPVVPTFQDWKFPSSLPDVWQRCVQPSSLSYPISAAQSTMSDAVHRRDVRCRVTTFQSACEAAHLIPDHENRWFQANNMAQYNNDFSLDAAHVLSDLGNAVLLRKDIHYKFDERAFVFFPKHSHGLVLHMLSPTPDMGPLYHNTPVDLSQCRLEFIFARFAWALFPALSVWLSKPGKSRRVIHFRNALQERVIEEVENDMWKGSVLSQKTTASRSNSPTKRSRTAAQMDEEEGEIPDDSRGRKRYRQSRPSHDSSIEYTRTFSTHRSCIPTTPTLGESIVTSPASTLESGLSQSPRQSSLERIRAEALAKQRPPGFNPTRPPYDPHRPAAEELERMGVEIIDDLNNDWG